MPAARQHKILLDESEMPTRWYNVLHDLPTPPPPVLHPGTGQPVGPDDLAPLFPVALIEQEVTGAQYVEIPGEVLDVYRLWRPSPLFRAHRLEQALGTPARIYYKYEGVSPAGSHKPNTAVPQALLQRQGRDPQADHGDRRGPVGLGAGVRVRPVRARLRGLAGARLVRPEAVPQDHDGDLRRRRCTPARRTSRTAGREILAEHPDSTGLARHRDQRGRRGRGAGPEHQLRAGQRAQPRAAAPDDDRRGGVAAARAGRGDPGPARRLHRRRLELRRPDVPVPAGAAGPGG